MSAPLLPSTREILHGHLFCGLGGGAKGFNRAAPKAGGLTGRFRCVGGIDSDPAAVRDFSRHAGVAGTVLDLFDRRQFEDWHGHEPPPGWRPAEPEDVRRAFGNERPHIVFTSPPCKGLSGLLSESKSKTVKYQALNRLTVRGIWLALEAFRDDPVEFIILENVPRIANRGRYLLDQIVALLRAYGYVVAETTHDCGEIGGLAQSRKRFLLVARHAAKVPPFLYEPPKRALRGVGEVLGRMLMPGDERAGPMHRCPSLQFQTWVRLAFVEAGSDWRSLNKLAIEDGKLRDYLLVPEMHGGVLGVRQWDEPSGVVPARAGPTNGAYSVADPRVEASPKWHDGQQYGVNRWSDSTTTIAGQQAPGQGRYAVSDPRAGISDTKQNNCFRVVRWQEASGAVTAGTGPSSGGLAVADPRSGTSHEGRGKYGVTPYDSATRTVIAGSTTGQGACAVADPRPGYPGGAHTSLLRVGEWSAPARTVTGASHPSGGAMCVQDPRPGLSIERPYLSGGHYGVVPWDEPSGAVSQARQCHTGPWSVADARLPEASERGIVVIRALDGTWHRPFTTLELAALQSLVDPEEQMLLDGLNDQQWRERIGNAVPPDAAEAIAETMGLTLLLAWQGEGFKLSSVPIWVQQIAVAVSVSIPEI